MKTTSVASGNLVYTLTAARFEVGLRLILADRPHIVCLQEAGPNRDGIIQRVSEETGYDWARAKGGGVVMWQTKRYTVRACRPVLLAGAEFVGHIPGRKDRLPASICTEVILDERATGDVIVVENFHLTAEIQDVRGGNGYKKDPLHLLRVLRHLREKHRLGRRCRRHKRHARRVFAVGDGNFAGMRLGGFTNCWDGKKTPPHGTLGGRPVDIVFAAEKRLALWTLQTPSDHDALVVTYR